MAVEADVRDVFLTRRFSAGDDRMAVESAWRDAHTPRQRVALAVHDDKGAALDDWIAAKPWRKVAMAIAGEGVHRGMRGDPLSAVRDVERAVGDIRGRVR